ncbi:MAG: ABC transporter ATP-binding protein, partial [Oscillospiraceae bacterium]|nr:ABC transporter ATP-binding protein [Oscillospiraceae bacterium]
MQKIDFRQNGLRVFLSYFKPHWKLFTLDMICAIGISVIDLIFPILSRTAMQRLLPNKLFTTFFLFTAIMLLSYLLKGVLYYVITVIGHGVGVLVEADMRRDAFTHLQDLSFSFYDH